VAATLAPDAITAGAPLGAGDQGTIWSEHNADVLNITTRKTGSDNSFDISYGPSVCTLDPTRLSQVQPQIDLELFEDPTTSLHAAPGLAMTLEPYIKLWS
jgi:hypothetical protein